VKYLTAVLMVRAMGCFNANAATAGPEPVYCDTDLTTSIESDTDLTTSIESDTLKSCLEYGDQLSASCLLNAASCMVQRKSPLHTRGTLLATDNRDDSAATPTCIADIARLGPLKLCEKALAASDSMAGRYRRIMVLKELRQ
jgi:hypothetical protein